MPSAAVVAAGGDAHVAPPVTSVAVTVAWPSGDDVALMVPVTVPTTHPCWTRETITVLGPKALSMMPERVKVW